jgi:hypothetical protein
MRMTRQRRTLVSMGLIPAAFAVGFVHLAVCAASEAVTEEKAYEIGFEAYIYLFPLVTMDLTRRQATNIEPNKMPGGGPMNAPKQNVLDGTWVPPSVKRIG